jgi:hypothetical protein
MLRLNNPEVKYSGRNSKTSGNVQHYENQFTKELPNQVEYLHHQVAYFHHDQHTATMHFANSQVLGNGQTARQFDTESNKVSQQNEGMSLWDYCLTKMFGLYADRKLFTAEYIQQEMELTHSIAQVFPGHIDKAFVTTVMFVPLTTKIFYTWIACPVMWNVNQNANSNYTFQKWVSSLDANHQDAVSTLRHRFLEEARKAMKTEVNVYVYECWAGSVLCFPANICYHMTITPAKYTSPGTPRDLFIIYPTVNGM